MMTNSEARSMAAEINRAVFANDGGTLWNAIFPQIKTLNQIDRELVLKFQGLEIELEKRAHRRARGDCETYREPGNGYDILWTVSRYRNDGEKRTHRYYMASETGARQWARQLPPQPNNAAYSPTGQWYRAEPTVKHLRGNIWQVTSSYYLDC